MWNPSVVPVATAVTVVPVGMTREAEARAVMVTADPAAMTEALADPVTIVPNALPRMRTSLPKSPRTSPKSSKKGDFR